MVHPLYGDDVLDKGDDLSAVLDQFEVLIDFTRPEATLDYLAICLSANKAMVIGTTGFLNAFAPINATFGQISTQSICHHFAHLQRSA
jgi:dihydrodipicolinate reductase